MKLEKNPVRTPPAGKKQMKKAKKVQKQIEQLLREIKGATSTKPVSIQNEG